MSIKLLVRRLSLNRHFSQSFIKQKVKQGNHLINPFPHFDSEMCGKRSTYAAASKENTYKLSEGV